MSRGPGKWQRLILEKVQAGPVLVRWLGKRQAEWSALHRAVHRLADAGKVDLHERLHPHYDKPVLVATLPGVVPTEREPGDVTTARRRLANPIIPLWKCHKDRKLLEGMGVNVDEIVNARNKSRPPLSLEEYQDERRKEEQRMFPGNS